MIETKTIKEIITESWSSDPQLSMDLACYIDQLERLLAATKDV